MVDRMYVLLLAWHRKGFGRTTTCLANSAKIAKVLQRYATPPIVEPHEAESYPLAEYVDILMD